MAKYFRGRKFVGQFEKIVEDGRGKINCEIFEEWIDSDKSSTTYCGDTGSCTVEKSLGLSEKTLHTLKEVIEASIGINGLISLKSQVEETIGHEVNWTVTDKVTKTFTFNAPKCGRSTLVIYVLTRFYELTYYRKKLFSMSGNPVWVQKWTKTIPERTDNHDAFPDKDDYHESCNCPDKKDSPAPDGYLSFDMGRISFRAPYCLTDSGFIVEVGEKKFNFNSANLSTRDLDYGFQVKIPISMIPEPLLFLGGVTEQKIPGCCQVCADHQIDVVEAPINEEFESLAVGQVQEMKISE